MGQQQGLSNWESPRPVKVNLVLPGSLVVDAEGMEDVQEGREEGEELHERKKRKGQLAESNPISSQCSQHEEASQHRAPSSFKGEAKPQLLPASSHVRLSVTWCTLRSQRQPHDPQN